MKTVSKQVHVDLVGNHAASHLCISDEEHMFISRAGKFYAAKFANSAASPVASGNPCSADVPLRTVW